MPREHEPDMLDVETPAGMSAEDVYNFLRRAGAEIGRIESVQDAVDVFASAPIGEVLTYQRKRGGTVSIKKLEDGSWQEYTEV